MRWTPWLTLAAAGLGGWLVWRNRETLGLTRTASAEEGRMDMQSQVHFAGGGRAEPTISRVPGKGTDEAGYTVAMNDGVEPAVFSNQRPVSAEYAPFAGPSRVDHDPRTVPHTTFGHISS